MTLISNFRAWITNSDLGFLLDTMRNVYKCSRKVTGTGVLLSRRDIWVIFQEKKKIDINVLLHTSMLVQ